MRSGIYLTYRTPVKRGVKQSSVISPALFNNAICRVSRNIPPFLIDWLIDISHLSYADDFVLLAKDLDSLQSAVNIVQCSLSDIGLFLEPSKMEFIVFHPTSGVDESLLVG